MIITVAMTVTSTMMASPTMPTMMAVTTYGREKPRISDASFDSSSSPEPQS